jgi:hypothetical protein
VQDNFEPNYKRVKLENDPWADYSPPCISDDGTGTISDGGECSSAMELNDEDKEHHVFSFFLYLFHKTKQNVASI